MYSRYEIFRALFLVLFSFILQPVNSFSSRTFFGKYFSDHKIQTVKLNDWMECLNRCFEEPLCISYNFHQRERICELNDHGVEDFSHPDRQLVDETGWIFHQIRPVTMTTSKVFQKSSCPCNCGSSDQCYPEPGLGDVPEKPASSCGDILTQRGQVPDGAYYLTGKPLMQKVYCQMTPIDGCDANKGGWTLVLKINGSKSTFHYKADLWTLRKLYQEEFGVDLSKRETKLKTFKYTSFRELCVGMQTLEPNSTLKWMKFAFKESQQRTQMFPIFNGHETRLLAPTDANKWKQLIDGSVLDDASESGFQKTRHQGARARIGIIGSQSYIGFGTGGPGRMGNVSCGNVNIDNNTVIPTFGYILVR